MPDKKQQKSDYNQPASPENLLQLDCPKALLRLIEAEAKRENTTPEAVILKLLQDIYDPRGFAK